MDAYIFFSTVLDMRRHIGLDTEKQDTVLILHDSRGDEASLRSIGIDVREYFSHQADTQHWASELYAITNNNSLEKLSIRFGLGGFAVPIAHNPGNDARKTMECVMHMLHHDYGAGGDTEQFDLRQRNLKVVTMDFESDNEGRITDVGICILDSRKVRALPESRTWEDAVQTFLFIGDEMLDSHCRGAYTRWGVSFKNLPRENFISGPSGGSGKVKVTRRVTRWNRNTERHFETTRSFNLSVDSEVRPIAELGDWIILRGGLCRRSVEGSAASTDTNNDALDEHQQVSRIDSAVGVGVDVEKHDPMANDGERGQAPPPAAVKAWASFFH